MIITKIDMKLRKEEFLAVFAYVNKLQVRVIKELDGRNALLTLQELAVYDYAPKLITQNKMKTWENYDASKRYSFQLPVGVAVALMGLLMMEKQPEISLKSFGSILYTRLINVFDPLVLDPLGPFKGSLIQAYPPLKQLINFKASVYGEV